MRKRSKQINRMLDEIRRRGGIAGLSDDTPDEMAELFLKEILDCPDCREEVGRMAKLPPRRDH